MAVVAHAIDSSANMMQWFRDGGGSNSHATPRDRLVTSSSRGAVSQESKRRHVTDSVSPIRQPTSAGVSDGLSPRRQQTPRAGAWLKKSRAWAQAYELSQDLHDMQMERLERKYGGAERARWAARVIQQAYRAYCVKRSFRRLRRESEDKVLSRRLGTFTRSNTIWTEMASSVEMGGSRGSRCVRCAADRLSVACSCPSTPPIIPPLRPEFATPTSSKVMVKSHSLNLCSADMTTCVSRAVSAQQKLVTIEEHVTSAVSQQQSWPALNDVDDSSGSSSALSPHDITATRGLDLPSITFQALVDGRETELLNDSFHSDSSDVTRGQCLCTWGEVSLGGPGGGEGHGYNTDCAVCCRERSGCGRMDTMMYCNTEVRLRRRRERASGGAPLALSDPLCLDSTIISDAIENADGSVSPIWKRKSALTSATNSRQSHVSDSSSSSGSRRDMRGAGLTTSETSDSSDSRRDVERGGISTSTSSDTTSTSGDMPPPTMNCVRVSQHSLASGAARKGVSDKLRKRTYRIGLNLFNKKPERGIRHLMEQGFLGEQPTDVAHFLLTRKGLSRHMIGDYLGNLQKPFNMDVLGHFSQEIDLTGLDIDVALRKFQTYFRMPGEAQKIEQLIQAFAHRYAQCNVEDAKRFHSMDAIFLLAYAIIMLNTDLHTRNMKPSKRMKPEDFVRNLRRVDCGHDIDRDLLLGIYERMKANELQPGSDHVSQVLKVEQMTVGLKMPLALPHRRLVCYCRLFEVRDLGRKEKPTAHQREVFLFNDLLLVTKVLAKKKNTVTYTYRSSFPVCGMQVYLFETSLYKHGIRLTTNVDGKVLITVNARNDNDRMRFVEDLKEIIMEVNEMEAMRIEDELQRQHYTPTHSAAANRLSKDSGVIGDLDLYRPGAGDPLTNRLSAPEYSGKRNTLTGSLVDLIDGGFQRTSGGSMDSGMASTCSGVEESRSHTASKATARPQTAIPPATVKKR